MSKRILFLLALIMHLFVLQSAAGIFTYSTKLQGSQISTATTLETIDDQYTTMTGSGSAAWHSVNANRSAKNYVHLKYTGAALTHYTANWSVELGLSIQRWDETGATTTETCSLKIDYNVGVGIKYTDISTNVNSNGHKVKVTITGIIYSGLSSMPADVMLENVLEVDRDHAMDFADEIAISRNTSGTPICYLGVSPLNVEFHWDYLEGAEEYDFEWVHKSDYDENTTPDFSKATRITTTNQYYRINLAYDNGKIYYRIRGVAKDFATGTKRLEGIWTYGQDVSGYDGVQMCNIEKRNWTYNAVYAEEGKRKEVMTYFDGSTRNRQSVTLSNTENIGLVTEGIYDYEGRSAVNTLPAPSSDLRSDLKFYQNFTLNGNGQWYTKKDFDDDDLATCGSISTAGFNSTISANGASRYYSANTPVISAFNGAIPDATDALLSGDAKSFPFTQTVYSNEGTVKMQSGPGPAFRIGSGHETKYMNATASQGKLDRLFGNEVGYAEHYREKVVIDPNGQVAVSYENLSGKVIATAMRGIQPSNLRALGPDVDEEKYMSPEPIHEHFASTYDAASESYTTVKNFMVTDFVDNPYNFTYNITPQEFSTICDKHYNCKYLLTITITDDCGNSISESEGATISSPCSIPVLGTVHHINAADFTSAAFEATYSVTFTHAGIYKIEKRLSLDPVGLQEALVDFETALRDPEGTCITSLTDLGTIYAAGVDQTECMSCEDAAEAEVSLLDSGDYPYVLDETHTFSDSSAYLAYLVLQCTPEIPVKSCDGLLAALVGDMSPGGQYFDKTLPNITFDEYGPGTATLVTTGNPNFINTLLGPNTDFYADFQTYVNSNSCPPIPASYPADLHSWLTDNWDDCYAGYLVLYHPEYCRWQRCVALSPSYDFDAAILSTNYAQATTLPTTGSPYLDISTTIIGTSVLGLDPYFSTIYTADAAAMNSQITACTTCASQFPACSGCTTMWDWADVAPVDLTGMSSGTPHDNARWANFVKLYVGIKANSFTRTYSCDAIKDDSYPPDNVSDANWLLNNPGSLFTLQLTGLTINDPEPLDNINTILTNLQTDFTDNDYDNLNGYSDMPCITTSAIATISDAAMSDIILNINCRFVNPLPTPVSIDITFEAYISIGVGSVQASSPITIIFSDWNVWTEAQRKNFLYPAINNAINAYHGSIYDFSSILALPSIIVSAPNLSGLSENDIDFILPACADGVDLEIDFGGATEICDPTPVYAPNCLCTQLQQLVDFYNAQDEEDRYINVNHTTYSTFESYATLAAANLSDQLGITITATNINYWRTHCLANNNVYPLELDESGAIITSTDNTNNAIPDLLKCDEPCQQQGTDEAGFYAIEAHEALIYQALQDFAVQYKQACLNADSLAEEFRVDYLEKEYHYTLYYYDQAGNLVRTVPPKGVQRIDAAALYSGATFVNNVHQARLSNGTPIYPDPVNHSRYLQGSGTATNLLVTNYKYNTLNQLQQQETPDGGLSNFYYNSIGQMRFSQNAKQVVAGKYSYTIYDGQGRIAEVGENSEDISTFTTEMNDAAFPSTAGTQVTKTYYDAGISGITLPSTQEFLRKRVSTSSYEDTEDTDNLTYNSATHYSYDVHGNVNKLVQDFPGLEINNNRYKNIDYTYDLISGNVNQVDYQTGEFDQYHHKYEYDANNRITHAYTSNNNIHWQQDARYFYYLHGPLARTEIGEEKVQCLDYAYTLQGWLKGVNTNTLGAGYDLGTDSYTSSAFTPYVPGQNNIHKNSAVDAYGFTLQYYNGDYKSANFLAGLYMTAGIENSPLLASINTPDLYNGNIKGMTTAMYKSDAMGGPSEMETMARVFHYDQLNRIKEAQSVTTTADDLSGLGVLTTPLTTDYYESFNYDANGNIRKAVRNGYAFGPYTNEMDNITYNYLSETDNNKLDNVGDAIPDNPANFNDIKEGQTSGNYHYDEIGNLDLDEAEGITDIDWNVYGKIKKIYKATHDIEFKYDASGNRVTKIAKPNGSTQEDWDYTYYVRDPQGNVMAIYYRSIEPLASTDSIVDALVLSETPIYGSSRLGVEQQEYRVLNTPSVHYQLLGHTTEGLINASASVDFLPITASLTDHLLGNKQYELSNHLGNVNMVISDHKIPSVENFNGPLLTGTICTDYYKWSFAEVPGTVGSVFIETNANKVLKVSNSISFSGQYTIPTVAGSLYTVTFDLIENTSSSLAFEARNCTGTNFGGIAPSLGSNTFTFTATTTTSRLKWYSTSGYWKIDNILVTGNGVITNHYIADVLSAQDYYSFGAPMPGRTTPMQTAPDLTSAGTKPYRYGFNGKESDFDVKNIGGSSYDFGARMYDPRLGRWLSTDKIYKASLSPYQFGKNSPTIYIDADGNDEFYFNLVTQKWTYKPAPGENRYYVSIYSMVDHKVQEIHQELKPGNPSVAGSKVGQLGATQTSLGLLGNLGDNDLTSLAKFCIQNPAILPLLESSENPKDKAISKYIKTYGAFNKVENSITLAADVILLADGAWSFGNILAKLAKPVSSTAIKIVEQHLEQFGKQPENEIMIERLKNISDGKIKATEIDMNFMKHELKESQLMKDGKTYEEAHEITLKEQGMYHVGYETKLYTKDALDAGNAADLKKVSGN